MATELLKIECADGYNSTCALPIEMTGVALSNQSSTRRRCPFGAGVQGNLMFSRAYRAAKPPLTSG